MLIVSLISVEAQVTIQPEWTSPVGSIEAISEDKTKFLTVSRGGFTYTDLMKDTRYTLLFEGPFRYNQWATMSSDGRYIVFVKGEYDSLKKWTMVKVLDAESGKELRTKKIDDVIFSGWRSKVILSNNNLLMFTSWGLLVTDFLGDSDSRIISDIGYNYSKLKISPKGSYMLETVGDTIIKIWETKTWSLHGTLRKESSNFSLVNFSPDESKLVTIDEYPGYAKIWDLKTLSPITTVQEDVFSFRYAAFSPNAELLVTLGLNEISIWNLKNGKKVRRYEKDYTVADIVDIRFSRDGDRILTNRDGMIRIWNVEDASKIGEIENNRLLRLANDSGVFGDTLISAENGQSQINVFVWRDKGFVIVDSLVGYDEMVVYASFSNNDKYIRLFGSSLQTLDVNTKSEVDINPDLGIRGRFFKVIGSFAIYETTSEQKYYAEVWDVEKNEKILRIPCGIIFYNFNILSSKDQSKIFIDRKDYDSNVRIMSAYDVKKKEYQFTKIDSLSTFQKKYFTSISPDGKKVLVIERDSLNKSFVKILDVSTGIESKEFFVDTNYNSTAEFSPVCTALFSPDGKQILITDSKRFVYIFDAETYTLLHTFDNGKRRIGWRESVKAVYSNSSEILAIFGLEHTIDLWDMKTAQKIITLPHQQNVLNIQFNKKENELMSSCADSSVYVWDIHASKVKYVLKGSKDTLRYINYSNNEKKVIAVSLGGPAFLWDLSLTTQAIEYEAPISKGQFLNIYPNPVENEAIVHLHSAINTALPYTITNSIGQKVYTGIIPTGRVVYTIPVYNLPIGVYFFTAEIGDKKIQDKFMVIH